MGGQKKERKKENNIINNVEEEELAYSELEPSSTEKTQSQTKRSRSTSSEGDRSNEKHKKIRSPVKKLAKKITKELQNENNNAGKRQTRSSSKNLDKNSSEESIGSNSLFSTESVRSSKITSIEKEQNSFLEVLSEKQNKTQMIKETGSEGIVQNNNDLIDKSVSENEDEIYGVQKMVDEIMPPSSDESGIEEVVLNPKEKEKIHTEKRSYKRGNNNTKKINDGLLKKGELRLKFMKNKMVSDDESDCDVIYCDAGHKRGQDSPSTSESSSSSSSESSTSESTSDTDDDSDRDYRRKKRKKHHKRANKKYKRQKRSSPQKTRKDKVLKRKVYKKRSSDSKKDKRKGSKKEDEQIDLKKILSELAELRKERDELKKGIVSPINKRKNSNKTSNEDKGIMPRKGKSETTVYAPAVAQAINNSPGNSPLFKEFDQSDKFRKIPGNG